MGSHSYTVVIEADIAGFHAYCPALPGCHTCGDTIEEATQNITDAVQLYLKQLLADGLDTPEDQTPVIVQTVTVDL